MQKEPFSLRVARPFGDRVHNASYSQESVGSEIVGLAYGGPFQREQFDSAGELSVTGVRPERKQHRVYFTGKRFFMVSHSQNPCPAISSFIVRPEGKTRWLS